MKRLWAKRGLAMLRVKAEQVAKNQDQAGNILDQAVSKASLSRRALQEVRVNFQALIRLLRAAIKGDYQQLPWKSLVTGLAAVLYFVNPLDLVPDFIAGIGLVDDLSVLGFALKTLKGDLDRFRQWEGAQEGDRVAEQAPR